MKGSKCRHCHGTGAEPHREDDGLSCFECEGMGELYEEKHG